MQELIEILEAKILPLHGNIEYINGMNAANNNIIYYIKKELIVKEKEQIVNAFEVGYKSCDIDEAFEINRKLASGELFYNKTYNQNI